MEFIVLLLKCSYTESLVTRKIVENVLPFVVSALCHQVSGVCRGGIVPNRPFSRFGQRSVRREPALEAAGFLYPLPIFALDPPHRSGIHDYILISIISYEHCA